ncbi:hypothetical protein ENBRE01_2128 [Enteropsectra breve]|nr:hypothetical protein ENBRE01_2128 [Enteropsectra breve]
MDENLNSEIHSIMQMKSEEAAKLPTVRILGYILRFSPTDIVNNGLLRSFLEYAFRILPGSSLPFEVMQKFGIRIQKRRKVSFDSKSIVKSVLPGAFLSEEGKRQQQREKSIIPLFNVNASKRYSPKMNLEYGRPFKTNDVTIYNSSVKNTFCPDISKTRADIPKVCLELKNIIENPQIVNDMINGW